MLKISILRLLTLLVCATQAHALTFTVNLDDDVSDPTPADGVCNPCTIRGAIESANDTPGGPHIVEIPDQGTPYTILDNVPIVAYTPMTIRGTGAAMPVITSGVFADFNMLRLTASITVENLEFRPKRGTTSGYISALNIDNDSDGVVRLNTVHIKPGADGLEDGIRVFNNAVAVCDNCRIYNGNASGLEVRSGGRFTLLNSRVTNNTAFNPSPAVIYVTGELWVINSLIDGNSNNSPGAGIRSNGIDSEVYLINSTVSGNSSTAHGGGLYLSGSAEIYNSTIARNTADADDTGGFFGGGIYVTSNAQVTIDNSIVHGNFLPCPSGVPLCFRPGRNCDHSASGADGFDSNGYTLLGDDANCTIHPLPGAGPMYTSGVIPHLGPLVNLGGAQPVHPINAVGVEADGGDPDGCMALDGDAQDGSFIVLQDDQRGFSRPHDSDPYPFDGGSCDVGAYEAKCFGDDPDGDYVGSQCDVCPNDFDPLQSDSNNDGIGDACSDDLIFASRFDG